MTFFYIFFDILDYLNIHNIYVSKKISFFLCKQLRFDAKKIVVDKKQSEFSMKTMIKKLHIKEPAEQVMAILGKR